MMDKFIPIEPWSDLLSLAKDASSGPWRSADDQPFVDAKINPKDDHYSLEICNVDGSADRKQNYKNADFIAAANPQNIIALIIELNKYKKLTKALEEKLNEKSKNKRSFRKREYQPLKHQLDR